EWERLFTKPNYRKLLRDYAISGNLRSSRFRSVCWKIFLDVLPDDISLWIKRTREWRKKYNDLKRNLIVNPHHAVDPLTSDLALNNPLSQADESPWNQYFVDNELRLTIKQDVIRTFPEVQFFQKAELQEKMIDALFCLSKTYEELSYRQGMHEVLAPLIFVLHCDHQAFLHASEVESLQEIIKEVMDPAYLEHDAYAMMSQIMQTIEPWYISKDGPMIKMSDSHSSSIPFARPQDLSSSNVIVTKLTRIQDYILKKFDVELHSHLERLEIAPQIYGIRWVRLLFGREFPMQDLLALWDAIFADGIGFELVDYIFVAMLLYIRDLLLASDYPQCLNCLMRYPPVGDIHNLIERAHYLREPKVGDIRNLIERAHYLREPKVGDIHNLIERAHYLREPKVGDTHKLIERAHYLREPKVGDTHKLIERAHYLREPKHYPRPPNYSYQSVVTEKTSSNKHKQSNDTNISSGTNKPRSITSSWSEFSKKMRPKTLSMSSSEKGMYKSTSVPIDLQTEVSPGTPQHQPAKRGSSASLSHVEDDMSRPMPSPASMARLAPTTRSVDSSPAVDYKGFPHEEPSMNGSVQHFATLPKPKGKGRKSSKQEQELEAALTGLQGQLNEKESMCHYAASKLDIHITRLQSEILQQKLENEDEILLAIAGIKQVRDVLRGTLKFSQMEDEEISFRDNYYVKEISSTPDSDQSEPTEITHDQGSANQSQDKSKLFYMSSEENSTANSPTDTMKGTITNSNAMKSQGTKTESKMDSYSEPKNFELKDYRSDKYRSWSDSKWDYRPEGSRSRSKSKNNSTDERSRAYSDGYSKQLRNVALEPVTDCIRNMGITWESPNPLYRRVTEESPNSVYIGPSEDSPNPLYRREPWD
ncbi:hypothetical protein FSP39_024666, partial [Pinctada imbricata]